MKWIGISGSRQLITKEIENDVRREVRVILENGDGVATGGAIGVDYFAMDEVFKAGLIKNRIKIFLPVTLDSFIKHYEERVNEGIVTKDQAEELINLLRLIKENNSEAIIENKTYTTADKESNHARNSEIVSHSDKLLAFQVNNSSGTENTIDEAKSKGKEVKIFKYN